MALNNLNWILWHEQQREGVISGSRPGEFQATVTATLQDRNISELTVTSLPAITEEVVQALAQLIAERNWKSITINEARDPGTEERLYDRLLRPCVRQTKRFEFVGGIELSLSRSIARSLVSPLCVVRVLSLREAKLSIQTASILGQAIGTSGSLAEFALSQSRICSGGFTALLGHTPSQLRAIYLSDCRLKTEEVQQVVHALELHPKLKTLYLNGEQQFGTEVDPILARGLETHLELENLQLPASNRHCPRIQTFTELNRGGRRLLRTPNASPGLWPLVLERVSQLRTMNDKSKANVLYFFVHQLHGRENHERGDTESSSASATMDNNDIQVQNGRQHLGQR
jgi:hypothetical protein